MAVLARMCATVVCKLWPWVPHAVKIVATVDRADALEDVARAGCWHRLRDEVAAAARGPAAEALTARSGAPRPATKYRISCKREVA